MNPGYPLGRDDRVRNGLLVAITERRTEADIDRLAEVLGGAIAAEAEPRAAGHEHDPRSR